MAWLGLIGALIELSFLKDPEVRALLYLVGISSAGSLLYDECTRLWT